MCSIHAAKPCGSGRAAQAVPQPTAPDHRCLLLQRLRWLLEHGDHCGLVRLVRRAATLGRTVELGEGGLTKRRHPLLDLLVELRGRHHTGLDEHRQAAAAPNRLHTALHDVAKLPLGAKDVEGVLRRDLRKQQQLRLPDGEGARRGRLSVQLTRGGGGRVA